MDNIENRRNELRLKEKATVFVEIRSASFDNEAPANIIICNSIDISASGIQVEMDKPVAVGSVLRIGAELSGVKQALYLVGEAKWIKPKGNNFAIGFELYDAENTDIDGWKEIIAAML